ncbi:unnamed protein product [Ectocarpus sp. 12 AP-2014]
MVAEPHRPTTLTATSSVALDGGGSGSGSGSGNGSGGGVRGGVDTESGSLSVFSWKIVELGEEEVGPAATIFEEEEGGPEVSVEFNKPGGVFLLAVEERLRAGAVSRDGTVVLNAGETAVIGRATIKVSCKHVRRELRDLSEADREAFLDAMEAYYAVPKEDGRAKYGEGFFDYQLLASYHSADLKSFCYHAGVQFLTAHAAFGLMLERSLQKINPRVSLPFWDYMIEAETLGPDWQGSPIFDDDMFGRAMGSADNGYQISDGRFGKISAIYDPHHDLPGNGLDIGPHHNAYGYLSATYNYQEAPLLTRTSSFCNLKADSVFATSDDFFGCFSAHDTLGDWEHCMESKVHGDMHGLLGGAFKCNVDMHEFHEDHPEYTTGLLTFVVEYLTTKFWPNNNFMPPGSNTCDTECVSGQEPCGCTCSVDAMALSEDEIYSLTSTFLSQATQRFSGHAYISYDESSERPWGFQQNGERLDDDATMFLLRQVVKLGCEPGAVGVMVGGVSPMDPLFWVLHPLFEKALHVLWMSPTYRDGYSFDWTDGSCSGSKVDDVLPFTAQDLGMGAGTDLLTNRELMDILHPSNPRLPFVFEKFDTWGTAKSWDFCPECAAAAAAAAAKSGGGSPPPASADG